MKASKFRSILAGLLAAVSMANITLAAAAEFPEKEKELLIGSADYFADRYKPAELTVKDTEASVFGLKDAVFVDEYGNEYTFMPKGKGADTDMLDTALPTSYNLYDYNRVTSVKNQNPYGTCWSFAGCSAAESNMITQGLANTSIDYSEKHMVWFTLGTGPSSTSDPTYGDCEELGYSSYNRGGFVWDAICTLAKRSGAELNSTVPYNVSSSNYTVDEKYRYDSYAHLTDATFLDTTDKTAIKQAIMNNGALYLTYKHRYAAENEGSIFTYYNPTASISDGGHAVSLVGWDDNFSKDNFSTVNGLSKPSSNGAWLIKNSWGTGFGNNGLMWMSYEETTINAIAAYTMAPVNDYKNIYQWDGNGYNVAYATHGFANIFTARGNESLKAVSALFMEDDYDCTIRIYTGLTDASKPTSGKLVYTSSTFDTVTGYHTYKLPNPISLTKGEKFAVVFDTYAYMIKDSNAYAANTTLACSSTTSFSATSYNVCIKAFTENESNGPKNVKAVPGDKKVKVTWDAVSGATKYVVYSILNGQYTNRGTTTGTSFTVTGLTNGTKYGFLVQAYVNGAWTSFTTNDIVYATPVAKPVVTATPGNGQVKLTWNTISGATKYIVYSILNGTYTNRGTTTSTSLTVTGLTNGTKYGFLVQAYVNGAWTPFTSDDIVYATPIAKPAITVTPGNAQVTVKWSAVSGATKYIVYSILNGVYTNRGTTTATSFNVTGLANGTKYGFLVQAYVNGAWTPFTSDDIKYATPVAKPAITVTPGDAQVTVKWSAVSGATKYIVYSILNGVYTNRGTTTATSFNVTGLANGTKYGFLVQAYVNGAWTPFTSDDIKYATPAAKPAITVTPGNGQVTVKWNAVSGATKYIVYSILNGQYTNRGTTTATSFAVTGLTNGTKYGFLVQAYVNGAWTSFTADDIKYATPVAKPVITVTPGNAQVTVKWNAVSGASKYIVYSILNGQYTNRGTTTATSFTVTGLTNNTKYGFLVQAYINGAWTTFTADDIKYATPTA
ncbi:MAG: C1 family peptidase [Oscillospiraceae bacterium]